MDVPGKIAFPTINSPIIQPTLHISTALVYFVEPNKISGALYHLVATYSVIKGLLPSSSLQATDLAKPKSATFTKHSEFSNILLGFKSFKILIYIYISFLMFFILHN